jgi:hypothetical protein
MQELLRLHAEDKLTPEQADWFEPIRKPEELFDCVNDPHQLHNLANDASYKEIMERMRTVLDTWQDETGDMGLISEEKMIWMNYPDGERPKTHAPHFIPNTEGNRNAKILDGGEITAPTTVSIYCATQGASIAYTFEEGANPHWLLYTGPIRLKKGKHNIRAIAIRYGYEHSDEQVAEFVVN